MVEGSSAARPMLGWQLIAGRLLPMITFLGGARDVIPNIALGALKPGEQLPDTNGLTMSSALAVLIVALWAVVWLALGGWRTRTSDA
jgi:hypothetical protein